MPLDDPWLVTDAVREARLLATVEERTRWLAVLFADPDPGALERQRRALLVTALREAKLWPSTA